MQNNIKNIDDQISFELIGDLKLDDFLQYFSKRLKWEKSKRNKIKKFILNSNNSKNYYGLAIIDNLKIVGGILIINQNSFFLKDGLFEIVNISNLFVDKNYRGIISFKFLNHLNKSLEKYIITDYTPNDKTIKIWKKLKFSIADSFSYRLTIFKILEFRKFINQSDNVFLDYEKLNKTNYEDLLNKANTFKFVINDETLTLSYSKSYASIDFFFFKLRFRKLRILSINNSYLLRKYYLKIIFNLITKNFCPIIYFDCLNNNINKKNLSVKSIKNHLIKFEGGLINKIAPFGSEISINH